MKFCGEWNSGLGLSGSISELLIEMHQTVSNWRMCCLAGIRARLNSGVGLSGCIADSLVEMDQIVRKALAKRSE